jgi:hypothetical protein
MEFFLPEQPAEKPKIKEIGLEELEINAPNPGESLFVLQRNIRDNRKKGENLEIGQLLPGSKIEVQVDMSKKIEWAIESLRPEERKSVDFLVVASDTTLRTPDPEIKSEHKRSVETAEVVIECIKSALNRFELDCNQLINMDGKPIENISRNLADLKVFEDCPEYVEYLLKKSKTEAEFWERYEDDKGEDREMRLKLGAEGPSEIAERIQNYLTVLKNATKEYHKTHPGRRLIIFIETHYDTISPFVKRNVIGKNMDEMLPVKNGGGISISVDSEGRMTTSIQGQDFELDPNLN